MTAEIAILNKLGVALAADSLVTITSSRGEKTYNTSSKLFTLSKFHPVGVLTYGSVEIDTLPFEIIVKEFRERLGRASKPTLADYSNDLIKFIRSFTPSDSETDRRNFLSIAEDHALTLDQRFRRECRIRKLTRDRTAFTSDMKDVMAEILSEAEMDIARTGKFSALDHIKPSAIQERYDGLISKAVEKVFSDPKPESATVARIEEVILNWILSNKISDISCGIVVAGYGKDEHYPAVIDHETEGKICGVLKIATRPEVRVDHDNQSAIRAYAQRSAADLFIRGVDPSYQRFIDDGVRDLLPGLAEEVATHLAIVDRTKIDAIKEVFRNRAAGFIDGMCEHRRARFIDPLHDAVDFLDKPELATLAENLVSLTALKQKISLDLETVGGPIDVAVISKHDGFIWIKRKHYFSPDLNHSFITNYLKTDD